MGVVQVGVGLNGQASVRLSALGDAVAHVAAVGNHVHAALIHVAGGGVAGGGVGKAGVIHRIVVVLRVILLGGGLDAHHVAVGIHPDTGGVGAAHKADAAALGQGSQVIALGKEGRVVFVHLDRQVSGQVGGLVHVEETGVHIFIFDGTVLIHVGVVVVDDKGSVGVLLGDGHVAGGAGAIDQGGKVILQVEHQGVALLRQGLNGLAHAQRAGGLHDAVLKAILACGFLDGLHCRAVVTVVVLAGGAGDKAHLQVGGGPAAV